MNSKLSIVVPCYNCSKTLENAMRSILNQSERCEVVLVDDGSTDTTPLMCDEYAEKYKFVTVVHQENRGLFGAWAKGVRTAKTDYIAFCDADDWIEDGFVERLAKILDDECFDMVIFGATAHYSDGKIVAMGNRLNSGVYDREKIENLIIPHFFSNGEMESEIMLKSRWSKVFSKRVLNSVVANVSESVSIGEDAITTFVSVINSDKICCIDDYYPYHYMRNDESMIGTYDSRIFEKLDILYNEYWKVLEKYPYDVKKQILADQYSTIFVFMKKEIDRNPNGFANIIQKLDGVRNSDSFAECEAECEISKYSLGAKMFAELIIRRLYVPAIMLTKLASILR